MQITCASASVGALRARCHQFPTTSTHLPRCRDSLCMKTVRLPGDLAQAAPVSWGRGDGACQPHLCLRCPSRRLREQVAPHGGRWSAWMNQLQEERAVSRRLLSPLSVNVVCGDEVYSLVYRTQQEQPPAGEMWGSDCVSFPEPRR